MDLRRIFWVFVEARAFALVSEEGIAKGIRRIVAVTAGEAEAAIAAGQRLQEQLEAAMKLQGVDLEKEVAALKQVCADALRARGKDDIVATFYLSLRTHETCPFSFSPPHGLRTKLKETPHKRV